MRIGTVIAHDQKAYSSWKARVRRAAGSVGLAGADLERVVLGLAVSHPDLVAVRS